MNPTSRTLRPGFRGLLLLAVLASSALLAGPAAAQGLKIAVFDKQRIVDESKLGVAAKSQFEKLQATREQEVSEKQKAYETLQQSYTQKASVLSQEKRLEIQRDLARARDEFQSAMANADKDLQRAYQSALMEIVAKLDPVIAEFGENNGYDFMFDTSQIAFARPSHEVTNELIRRIDATHPG